MHLHTKIIKNFDSKMNVKHFTNIVVWSLLVLCTSCVSTKKIEQIINNKIPKDTTKIELISTGYIELKADSLLSANNDVKVKKKTSYLIPLVVYWSWKRTSECEISNRYFINLFNETLNKKIQEFPHKNYFVNKKLIIELISIPSKFYYSNKGTYIFIPYISGLGMYYTFENIYPDKQQIKVKYQFYSEEMLLKSGEEFIDFKYPVSYTMDPTGTGINSYLEKQKTEFNYQSNILIDKIIDSL